MGLIRPVSKKLPGGTVCSVFPFHLSFEGLEKAIICRDDGDCDTLVKCIFVCSRRKNVIVIIYAVVSNHAHVAVLARTFAEAKAFGEEVKRTYSQLFRKKYGESKTLRGTDVNVQSIDTDWYLRNVLAYIPRNAYDNGAESLLDYKWSGFRAFFRRIPDNSRLRPVSKLTHREWREIMHTGDDLSDVPWKLNSDDELEPGSACDNDYLEKAFGNDETFFYRCIGSVNVSEMTQKLVVSPRKMKTDEEFYKEIEDVSMRWFMTGVANLPMSKKARLIPYVYHTMKTTVPQMARGFGFSREDIRRLLCKV